jgi:hypothetical protein
MPNSKAKEGGGWPLVKLSQHQQPAELEGLTKLRLHSYTRKTVNGRAYSLSLNGVLTVTPKYQKPDPSYKHFLRNKTPKTVKTHPPSYFTRDASQKVYTAAH